MNAGSIFSPGPATLFVTGTGGSGQQPRGGSGGGGSPPPTFPRGTAGGSATATMGISSAHSGPITREGGDGGSFGFGGSAGPGTGYSARLLPRNRIEITMGTEAAAERVFKQIGDLLGHGWTDAEFAELLRAAKKLRPEDEHIDLQR